MKKELLDKNKDIRTKIKEKKDATILLQSKNQAIVEQGQKLQQELAKNNTEMLKLQGGIQTLESLIAK